MQHPAIGHDDAKSAVTFREMRTLFFGCLGGGGIKGPIKAPEELAMRASDSPAMTLLSCAPLMHGAGMWNVLGGLMGGHRVILNGRPDFRAEYVLDLLDREGVNSICAIGDAMILPIVEALAANAGRWDISKLFYFASSGALFSDHLRERLKAQIPSTAVIANHVGSSESGAVGSEGKTNSDGLICLAPNPSNAVLVDRTRFARPGEVGILARTGFLPSGYFKDPVKTAETFVEIEGKRYVLTGDSARLEEDGSITMFGRSSQCINTGGEKVFAEEVEEVIRGCAGVLDALVVGVPDSRWGQKMVAVVAVLGRGAPDADSIKAHCRSQLAGYKVPKDVVFVDQVVRTPVGKPDYSWAKRTAQDALGIAV